MIDNGIMQFKGASDFAPEHIVEPGSDIVPPAKIQAGAKADEEWSSVVVLLIGQLNAQMVSNASGDHNRLKSIDHETLSDDLSILDGFQGGRQYFYHLVTNACWRLPRPSKKASGRFVWPSSQPRARVLLVTTAPCLAFLRVKRHR